MPEEIDQPTENPAAEPAEAAELAEHESAFGGFRPAPEGTRRDFKRRSRPAKKREGRSRPAKKREQNGSETKRDQRKAREQPDISAESDESSETVERPRRDKSRRKDRRERQRDKSDAELPGTAPDEAQSPLQSFHGRVAVVEDTSVTVVEISAAVVESCTSLPEADNPAEALVAAAKAAGRKGVVALASSVEAVNLGSDRAEDPSAGRIQAALFASEHFGEDAAAALVGWLVVRPGMDDDCWEALKTLLKRGISVVPVVGCVPAKAAGAVWVRIGRSRVDMTLVSEGAVRDVHSVMGHGSDRYRKMLESGLDRDSAQHQWCSDTATVIAEFPPAWTSLLKVEPEVVMSGPVLADPNVSGRLVGLVRNRSKLLSVEAPAAMADLVGVSPTLAEPACAHAVTAALAAGSLSRLEVSARVLGEQRRRAWRAAVAVAACWVLVWAGLGWMSQRTGRSTEAELAAVEARIARAESVLANGEAADDFDYAKAEERYRTLAAPGPDWGTYLRWAHSTDHPVVLDRSGQSRASIQIEAASIEEFLHQRVAALEWLDCFARAVFDREGFARSTSRGVSFSSALPLTGAAGERIRFEPETAVWGVNPIEPIDGTAQPSTSDPVAPEGQEALLDRDDGRDCGPSPPHIRGLSGQIEEEP